MQSPMRFGLLLGVSFALILSAAFLAQEQFGDSDSELLAPPVTNIPYPFPVLPPFRVYVLVRW